MRNTQLERETRETSVHVSLSLDGTGSCKAETGVRFLDHLLQSLATHCLIDIDVKATGDLQHHIIEDVALTLGSAVDKSLGDRKGIRRFGYAIVPMDEALALSAVDLVRRPFSSVQFMLERPMIEDTPREDLEHFLPSLSTTMNATIHVKVLEGRNDHHKIEAGFKSFSLALRDAITTDPRRSEQLPTSKGMM
jgi:imidazoleglycerol phosphate dehydratase HisB